MVNDSPKLQQAARNNWCCPISSMFSVRQADLVRAAVLTVADCKSRLLPTVSVASVWAMRLLWVAASRASVQMCFPCFIMDEDMGVEKKRVETAKAASTFLGK